MIGHLVYAHGSPCPTFVLDARLLPRDTDALLAALTEARRYLAAHGGGHVLKIALVEPSNHPLFDLDYRFVQAMADGVDQFDLRGSCGHSVLSSIVAAGRSGMLPRVGPGDRVRVNVLNNDDHLVCEVDQVARDRIDFTMHFLQRTPVPVSSLLITGEPVTPLWVDEGVVPVSLVSSGNPYVFVGADSLGLESAADLIDVPDGVFDRMQAIRRAAAEHLGWDPHGAFPKIAAVAPGDRHDLVVRAITVPGWHPTLALTGAACLAAATRIEGTVPWTAAARAECPPDLPLHITTPNNTTTVVAATRLRDDEPQLVWTSVGGKQASFHGSFLLEPLAHLQFEEVAQCLASSTASV